MENFARTTSLQMLPVKFSVGFRSVDYCAFTLEVGSHNAAWDP